MHQTTCGAIPKKKIYLKTSISAQIQKIKNEYSKKLGTCLYQDKKISQNKVLNFLNIQDESTLYNQIKYLIRNEFDECEKIYPYLGDLFIHKFLNLGEVDKGLTFKHSKREQNIFTDAIDDSSLRDIIIWFFDNCSLDRSIIVEKSYSNDIMLKLKDNIKFSLEYDTDFLMGSDKHTMKNYRFLVVDGYIESVGEIHHLLHNAALSKLPYVIFCFGMSEEVKMTIIKNNALKKTEIIPAVIKFNEYSVNVLNDIAIIHNSDVVSALKGQTISQEVRKKLKIGNQITFLRDGFAVSPICTEQSLRSHRNFLNSKVRNSQPDTNISFLKERVKNLNTKTLKLFIPQRVSEDIDLVRQYDYCLKYISNISMLMCEVNFKDKKVLIPHELIKLVNKKVNSFNKIINNIDKAVIIGEKNVT